LRKAGQLNDATNKAESGAAELEPTSTSSGPIRRRRWYQRLKDRLWGYDFFISYHWASGGTYAVNLAARLREKGYEVFLDRAEYAMGDNWKRVGEVALRNTQRLILIATREAVFESKPVEREVVLFTDRGRHCMPIFFGDTFTAEEQANPGKFIVLDRLPDATLHIPDAIENLPIGPATEVVEKLSTAYGIMRRRKLRQTITLIAISLLATFAAFASVSWVNAVIARNDAREKEKIADRARDSETKAKNVAQERERDAKVNQSRAEYVAGQAALNQLKFDDALLWWCKSLSSSPDRDWQRGMEHLIGGYTSNILETLPCGLLGTAVAASSDGKEVVMLSPSRDKIEVWDAVAGKSKGRPIRKIGNLEFETVAISPNGTTIVTASGDKIQVWDVETGKVIADPLNVDLDVSVMLIGPDNKTLFTGSRNGALALWDLQTSEAIAKGKYADQIVTAAAFSNDGTMLMTAHAPFGILGSRNQRKRPGESQLWRVVGKTFVAQLSEPLRHHEPIVAVAVNPDRYTVITGSEDNTATIGS
jgi:hypothetical protein